VPPRSWARLFCTPRSDQWTNPKIRVEIGSRHQWESAAFRPWEPLAEVRVAGDTQAVPDETGSLGKIHPLQPPENQWSAHYLHARDRLAGVVDDPSQSQTRLVSEQFHSGGSPGRER